MVTTNRPNGSEGSMLPPGEPTSPREPRRSGRRSLPLVQTSAPSSSTPKSSESNSPGDEDQPPVAYQNPPQPKKRKSVKDEAEESSLLDYKPAKRDESKGRREKLTVDIKVANNLQGKVRGKRKSKAQKGEKMIETPVEEAIDPPAIDGEDPDGRTRCICGNTTGAADDDDDLTFWIQCETCKVWQHGRCVGYEKESDAPEHYHCEECRPDLHDELRSRYIKSTRTKPPSMRVPRTSRSHSPHPGMGIAAQIKRRNTMNSRETAYHDDLMKKVQEDVFQQHERADSLTALERASVAASSIHPEEEMEGREQEVITKKKRRSMTTPSAEQLPKARSESSASDRPIIASIMDHQVPAAADEAEEEVPAQVIQVPTQKRKRGQRKDAVDKRHPNQYTYRRGHNARDSNKHQSAQGSNAPATPTPPSHEHGTRRNPQSSRGQHLPAPQPLLTSWGLPDYLSHLSPLLPTPIPVPLQIPISSAGGGKYEEERGVKVKWPGKRMSTVDMVKRVRQLMEWVAREQANHNEREKRRIKIEQTVAEEAAAALRLANGDTAAEGGMDIDSGQDSKSIIANNSVAADSSNAQGSSTEANSSMVNGHNHKPPDSLSRSEKLTASLMEELMLELISFQEKYAAQLSNNELMNL